MSNEELLALLDDQQSGLLSEEQSTALTQQINASPDLLKQARAHGFFVKQVKAYGRRKALRATLDQIHSSIEDNGSLARPKGIKIFFTRYKTTLGIAAAVAVLTFTATFWTMQSYKQPAPSDYRELRRNIEQIKKSQQQIQAELAKSKIKTPIPVPARFAGTGFLVSANGYIATSFHVVKEADSIYIENETTAKLKVVIAYADKENDIAILKPAAENVALLNRQPPAKISVSEASLGEKVFTLGFPKDDIVFGEGSVSAATGFHENPNAYQISVPVNPGNSGGPLLDARGDIIGIISGNQSEASGTAFAVKSTVLLKSMAAMATDSTLVKPVNPRNNVIRNLSRVDQVKRWREMVFVVRVYKTTGL